MSVSECLLSRSEKQVGSLPGISRADLSVCRQDLLTSSKRLIFLRNLFIIKCVNMMRQLNYKSYNFCYFDCADITS